MIRNFIHIVGLASQNELPKKIEGQIITFSENEIIFIPQDKPEVKSIFQIMLNAKITSKRLVSTSFGITVILDGIKDFKIIYAGKDDCNQANIITLEYPLNTFVELPPGIKDYTGVEICVLDAFFDLIDDRKIYSHIVYLVNVHYDQKNAAGDNPAAGLDHAGRDNPIDFEISSAQQEAIDEISTAQEDEYFSQHQEKIPSEILLVDLDSEYL